jgi:hypothetical protein
MAMTSFLGKENVSNGVEIKGSTLVDGTLGQTSGAIGNIVIELDFKQIDENGGFRQGGVTLAHEATHGSDSASGRFPSNNRERAYGEQRAYYIGGLVSHGLNWFNPVGPNGIGGDLLAASRNAGIFNCQEMSIRESEKNHGPDAFGLDPATGGNTPCR